MFRADWSGPLTAGRQAYASTLDGRGGARNVNYESGFLIGWDRWSDGSVTLTSHRLEGNHREFFAR